MNSVNIIGRLTADIELKKTQAGKSVVKFTVAVNAGQDRADFIDCVAWEKTAEILEQYAQKGHRIGVTGKLTTNTWKDQNGNTRKSTEVLADRVELLESKKEVQKESQPSNKSGLFVEVSDSDLPF